MKYRKKPVVIDATQYDGTQEGNRKIIEWAKGSQTPALMDTVVGSCSPQNPEGFD
ncbi:hypothetical protein [Pseudomonas brassicacearum]|uniref:hypothetical protein n=1 Tax=Pseudomonas brassicacearum TaxID=930166 RepID=UPI001C83FA82|nr:hypothetical protein [Pseudomonas brassicacearum]